MQLARLANSASSAGDSSAALLDLSDSLAKNLLAAVFFGLGSVIGAEAASALSRSLSARRRRQDCSLCLRSPQYEQGAFEAPTIFSDRAEVLFLGF